eukprot:gene3975-4971_t
MKSIIICLILLSATFVFSLEQPDSTIELGFGSSSGEGQPTCLEVNELSQIVPTGAVCGYNTAINHATYKYYNISISTTPVISGECQSPKNQYLLSIGYFTDSNCKSIWEVASSGLSSGPQGLSSSTMAIKAGAVAGYQILSASTTPTCLKNFNEFMFGGNGMPQPQGRFFQKFKAYPVSFIEKSFLESGGKILLPPSALNTLSRLSIQYPMLFEISNPTTQRASHCGVLEFIAEEGICYLPFWMMSNLGLKEGDFIDVKSATLPKGTFVKIQPFTSNFLDISNPKAVLENSLRKFATLTKDDEIVIDYNNNKYHLKVVEIKPNNSSNAVSIIEADISVDFAPPMDSKEATQAAQKPGGNAAGSGGGLTFGTTSKPIPGKKQQNDDDEEEESSEDDDEPKFKAFGGSGMRLDGKVGTPPKTVLGTSPKPVLSSPTSTTKSTGLTFGSGGSTLGGGNGNKKLDEDSKDGKFVPFSGTGRSLKEKK